MKIWFLTPRNEKVAPWCPWYDKAFGFVVRAETEFYARVAASIKCGDEGRSVWLDKNMTKCEELTQDGEAKVILRDVY